MLNDALVHEILDVLPHPLHLVGRKTTLGCEVGVEVTLEMKREVLFKTCWLLAEVTPEFREFLDQFDHLVVLLGGEALTKDPAENFLQVKVRLGGGRGIGLL